MVVILQNILDSQEQLDKKIQSQVTFLFLGLEFFFHFY